MRLEGKVALITGSSKGQGAAEAALFAREGAAVVIADVLEDEGKQVEARISESGGRALFVSLDVSSEDDWARAVSEAVDAFGKIDILVNNAGLYSRVPIMETSLAEWQRILEVNTTGVFLGTKATIPTMQRAGGGSIINISSTAGLVGSGRGSAYGTSKGGIRLFTKYTAVQHANDGIRANSIHPGPIDTEMIVDNIGTPEGRATSESRIPMGRIGTVDDVAFGALFLASDESSYMTGAELIIDGGFTAQ
ncbi:MAG: glucose 1-dehydrogenase [SAR202 cluster bacterium]|jgi:NAD(P)-dependent dehydrogenase (short-subunit alcohol dehydrogenase family)|nr:glucose 1-dehydrogenase [SAR202 cluster bacterium]MDP6301923.1 glucose 1-dehydrogenase [SAR202 cluster bacterium]MDP7104143.1 glucose 1-dehydrogenase [SAR202 cluster bacterium]MDP7225862.1 glucose 1-dehydrogenase [SAR202 cluster bacterium]HJO81159.1 glucose 1-dehydrogenase [SAR202 cluster bacterium]|tara:strand:+ start:674 stop:1423 length:750 start_codon:yes stop_codon:yes gene_type:complete